MDMPVATAGLLGRNVLIFGGTSGIGLASAERFAAAGAKVHCVGRSTDHAVQTKEYLYHFDDAVVTQLDVTDDNALERFFYEYTKSNQSLDVLINSAGTISQNGIHQETSLDWDRVMDVNLRAAFQCCRLAFPLLEKAAGANIVNVSSVCGLRSCTSLSYSVSKAGLDMLTRCLARDFASQGIRVNSVNPGVVDTNLQRSAGLLKNDAEYAAWRADMAKAHPLHVIGDTGDVADAILYLASPQAKWVTGAFLSVDGGRSIV